MKTKRLLPFALIFITFCLLSTAVPAKPGVGPFAFCYGLERGGSTQAIKDLGLNTLYIDLLPSDVSDLQPCLTLIRSAQKDNLKVIIGLPTCLTSAYQVSPLNEQYTGSVRELIRYIVDALKDEPGVTAWGTGHSLERSLRYSDDDFRHYLQRGYPSLGDLNAFWGSNFPTWPSITREQAGKVDANTAYQVGRASVDVAEYQVWAFRETMKLWLEAIRAVDDKRPVLTGRVTLYRSLASIPDGYDMVCVSMPPDVLEADVDAHNVQAVDMARRGGRFGALPVFRVPYRSSPVYTQDKLRDWIAQAALHGASGFALEDWSLISEVYELEQRLPVRSRHLTRNVSSWRDLTFGVAPKASTALVYSPYAEGFAVTSQPVYGYLTGLLPGEPSTLINCLKFGSRYGLVDYLCVDDLPQAELDQYGAILLPACLRLPRPQAVQLEEYIGKGGAAIADLGLGMYESGSWAALPEDLPQYFGIAQMGDLTERVGDLTVGATALHGLPGLHPGARSEGLFSARKSNTGPATERKPWTVSGWAAEAALLETAVPVATLSVRFDEEKVPHFAGLIGRAQGSGLGLFATHPLWQYWPVTDPLSSALHASLLSRRAPYELMQTGLLPATMQMSGDAEGLQLLNAADELAVGQVWAYAAGSRAYLGAVAQFMASPIERGLPAGTALILARVPERQVKRLMRIPLLVQPRAEDATVEVQEYGAERVVLRVFGGGAMVRNARKGFDVEGAGETPLRLVLSSGTYRVAPSSRHLVAMRGRTGRESRNVAMADPRGELDLSAIYQSETLTISPAP
ncbi:MAG: hypothetical protein ABFE07_20740 [Armatimonadia bacterium]